MKLKQIVLLSIDEISYRYGIYYISTDVVVVEESTELEVL